MKTQIVIPDKNGLKKASEAIKRGGIVVFPTETVYGIGADAFNEHAVRKIFSIKHRPADNPLIIHIAKSDDLKKLVKNVPKKSYNLIKKFWPGPLTLIFPKKSSVPDIVTAGLRTVAVRMPSNKIIKKMIELAGCPIAAPSANISGRPSCTSDIHAISEFDGYVDVIIKGGKCKIGLESTVVKTGKKSYILRPGKISLEDLKKFIPSICLNTKSDKPMSPGMKYRHYAPKAEIILIKSKKNPDKLDVDVIITTKNTKYRTETIKLRNKKDMAKQLFFLFHELDKKGVRKIAVEGVDESGIGLAIMNRVIKASTKIV